MEDVRHWTALACLLAGSTGCGSPTLSPRAAVLSHFYDSASPHDVKVTSGPITEDGDKLYMARDGDIQMFMRCSSYPDTVCDYSPAGYFGGDQAEPCRDVTAWTCEDIDCNDDEASCTRLLQAAARDDLKVERWEGARVPSGRRTYKRGLDCLGMTSCR